MFPAAHLPADPLSGYRGSLAARWRGGIAGAVRTLLVIGIVVWSAATLGLASRHAFSVSFWPANAVLVGMMLRDGRRNRPAGWIGAAIGFVVADLLFGRTLSLAGYFAGTNLIGTFGATLLLRRLDARDLALRRVHSVLRILVCLLPACFAAALAGAVLVVVEFGGSATQALLTWPASELVNYLIVLPAMLTVSPRSWLRHLIHRERRRRIVWGPTIGLFLSCAAAVRFDGPGSIMFPMPALLLCALTYGIPTTALLTMVLGTGSLTAIGMGVVDIGQDMSVPAMVVSIRVAVAFLVIVPLTIASAMAVRDELLDQLREAADHDGLTGLLNRRAFEQRMDARMAMSPAGTGGRLILWLDIDHFKGINDRFGHPAGDAVLRAFARTARDCCREGDMVGRVGGEEFALVADVTGHAAATALAERLRDAFATHVTMWNDQPIHATVSMGAAFARQVPHDVHDLIRQLDEALYRAKRNGRNRIEWL